MDTMNPFAVIEERLIGIEVLLWDLKKLQSTEKEKTETDEDIGGMGLAEQITGLAKPTIYALVAKDKIPFMKKNKKLYFSRQGLLDWIKSGRRKTIAERQDDAITILRNPRKKQ